MTLYQVSYLIDIETDTPAQAAREAYDIMMSKESLPAIMAVQVWPETQKEPSGPVLTFEVDDDSVKAV